MSDNKKCVILIFYFGKLPDYFRLFLNSCRARRVFSWRIYTDQKVVSPIPLNVQIIPMSFEECRKLFSDKLPFQISLQNPKKLCDFKPLYGFILEDTLQGYDYWGCSDLDVICGDMDCMLLPEIIFDKNFSLGHCTFYRNTPEVNRRALSFSACEKALQSPVLMGFDEWGENAMNSLFPGNGFTASENAPGLDISAGTTLFYRSSYQKESGLYAADFSHMGIIHICKNGVYWCYRKNGSDLAEEAFPYVHLQKRKLKVQLSNPEADDYYIVPGKITDQFTSPWEALEAAKSMRILIDKQWLKLKWFNFRRKLGLLKVHLME